MFCKKAILRYFPKFTRKHLCQSLFITKVAVAGQGQQLYLKSDPVCWFFNKKETPTQVFSCEYHKISKNSCFIEHPWWLLLNMVKEFVRISNSS